MIHGLPPIVPFQTAVAAQPAIQLQPRTLTPVVFGIGKDREVRFIP